MTDVVVYQPRSSIELAPDAWTLSSRIAATDFVPTAFRGKPEAVLCAILTGNELGIDAMQSLAKIHVIEGKPAISAELMRALVLRAGHEMWVEEATATKCTVAGKRRGSEQTSRVTWTLDDAKRAGLEGRPNWRKYPKQMLLARASSELARTMFADVLAGVSYSVEELTDGDVIDDDDVGASVSPIGEPPPRPKRNARRATRAATAATAPAEPEAEESPAPARSGAPPLPGEDGDVIDVTGHEVVEPLSDGGSTGGESVPDGGSSADSPPGSPGGEPTSEEGTNVPPAAGAEEGASPPAVSKAAQARAQRAAIACNEVGIQTDDERHRFLAAVTDGRAWSGKGLTTSDLELVLEAAERFGRGEVQLVEEDGVPALRETA